MFFDKYISCPFKSRSSLLTHCPEVRPPHHFRSEHTSIPSPSTPPPLSYVSFLSCVYWIFFDKTFLVLSKQVTRIPHLVLIPRRYPRYYNQSLLLPWPRFKDSGSSQPPAPFEPNEEPHPHPIKNEKCYANHTPAWEANSYMEAGEDAPPEPSSISSTPGIPPPSALRLPTSNNG